jgi:acyl carrier protein
MCTDEIRSRVKQAIAKVCQIDAQTIGDHASFREDLGLDSLSILETVVEVQCRFKIPDFDDGELSRIRTVEEAVRFVQQRLSLEVA